jgi:hypothetical protein
MISKYDTEMATTIGTVMFGIFCIFVAMAGIIYIAALNNQVPTVTDTYGTAPDTVTNASQLAVVTMTAEEETSMIPLVLLATVIGLCVILFIAWVWSKGGISV